MTYLCPDSTFAQLPSSALQTRTVVSNDPDAISLPSGLQATAFTQLLPNFSYIGNRQQRPLAGEVSLYFDRYTCNCI